MMTSQIHRWQVMDFSDTTILLFHSFPKFWLLFSRLHNLTTLRLGKSLIAPLNGFTPCRAHETGGPTYSWFHGMKLQRLHEVTVTQPDEFTAIDIHGILRMLFFFSHPPGTSIAQKPARLCGYHPKPSQAQELMPLPIRHPPYSS